METNLILALFGALAIGLALGLAFTLVRYKRLAEETTTLELALADAKTHLDAAKMRLVEVKAQLADIDEDRQDLKRVLAEIDYLHHQATGAVFDVGAVGEPVKVMPAGLGDLMRLSTWAASTAGKDFLVATKRETPIYEFEGNAEQG